MRRDGPWAGVEGVGLGRVHVAFGVVGEEGEADLTDDALEGARTKFVIAVGHGVKKARKNILNFLK